MALLETFANADNPVILDGNFNGPKQSIPVREFTEHYDLAAIEICLWGDPDVLRTRFIDRADPPLTEDLFPYFEQALQRPREPVLRPPLPVLEVDTTDFRVLELAYPHLLTTLQGFAPPLA